MRVGAGDKPAPFIFMGLLVDYAIYSGIIGLIGGEICLWVFYPASQRTDSIINKLRSLK